ncbi:glycosyltransferase [Agromyces aurantiacus]|uniref:Glycosyltransferase n=1 Tax=Agromyces aurantiacus TaxID=165814 RepID=A0ABV9R8P9_9MICO|nr:nucleotide disphospho-sugar-binding domain-containing protein [Agromyces aurantiacus]MBM7504347.1 UDP:flavonoid glycosyltransferase YjiC (YdhE family) [Agromyces aurantiacus]
MARFLSVLPLAGGNVPPTLLILRELESRGHRVRILGHAALRPEIERAGLDAGRLEPFDHARPWNPRAAEPGVRSMLAWLPLASDRGIARDLEAAIGRERPDALLIDCMVPGSLDAAHHSGIPTALLLHTLLGYWEDQWSARAPMGLWLRVAGAHPLRGDRTPRTLILTTDPELDPPGEGRIPRDRIAQVGPIIPDASPRDLEGVGAGRVLVAFSTIGYPGQVDVLARVMRALADEGVEALVTTGPAVDPARLPAMPGIDVRAWGDHGELLRSARLLVGHGGHGTTMRALAAGVPVLVVPMTRHADHHLVARAVERAGLGAQVAKDAAPDRLRDAIRRVLADPEMTVRTRAWADRRHGSSGAQRAAELLEGLASGRTAA